MVSFLNSKGSSFDHGDPVGWLSKERDDDGPDDGQCPVSPSLSAKTDPVDWLMEEKEGGNSSDESAESFDIGDDKGIEVVRMSLVQVVLGWLGFFGSFLHPLLWFVPFLPKGGRRSRELMTKSEIRRFYKDKKKWEKRMARAMKEAQALKEMEEANRARKAFSTTSTAASLSCSQSSSSAQLILPTSIKNYYLTDHHDCGSPSNASATTAATPVHRPKTQGGKGKGHQGSDNGGAERKEAKTIKPSLSPIMAYQENQKNRKANAKKRRKNRH
ncbi:unnamed protein product [Vitrella brassicaformis CCMP3155]|uniref:Uncharacterized protein n=2 Tax=Vitrella brassicaformis TaxID=1169539 RepID=A0A0G4ELG9_VITBC|nr:unnamed protein product [Vitrella brassicaformis CCMP3155]|eukprot:CEL98021.1 unnamed protein product [Vitrella brassicaformis CCMP3155]